MRYVSYSEGGTVWNLRRDGDYVTMRLCCYEDCRDGRGIGEGGFRSIGYSELGTALCRLQ